MMKRPRLGLLLQLVASIVLLALVARQVPLDQSRSALARIRIGTIAGACALALVGYWGRSFRWSVLLRHAGIAIRPFAAYRLTLVGILYGIVTPGRVGEFARIVHLGMPRSRSLPSVIWDRVADVLLLEVMSLPAFLFLPGWRGPLLWIFLGLVAATVAGIVVLDHPASFAALRRMLPRLAQPLERYAQASAGTLLSPAFRAGILGGLFFYLFSYVAAWLLLRDLAPHASPRLLLALPIIPLLGNLPIAFGGLGLREQVSASVFGQVGAGAAIGPVFSLLWFMTTTLAPGLAGLALAGLGRSGQVTREVPDPEQAG